MKTKYLIGGYGKWNENRGYKEVAYSLEEIRKWPKSTSCKEIRVGPRDERVQIVKKGNKVEVLYEAQGNGEMEMYKAKVQHIPDKGKKLKGNVRTCDICKRTVCDEGKLWIGGHPHSGWFRVQETGGITALSELKRKKDWDICSQGCFLKLAMYYTTLSRELGEQC